MDELFSPSNFDDIKKNTTAMSNWWPNGLWSFTSRYHLWGFLYHTPGFRTLNRIIGFRKIKPNPTNLVRQFLKPLLRTGGHKLSTFNLASDPNCVESAIISPCIPSMVTGTLEGKDRYFGDIPDSFLRITTAVGLTKNNIESLASGKNLALIHTERSFAAFVRNILTMLKLVGNCKFNPKKLVYLCDNEIIENIHIANITLDFLKGYPNLRCLFVAYEGHPRHRLILKKIHQELPHIRTVGYVHNSFTNIGTNLFHLDGSPKNLLVHGTAYREFAEKYLNWPNNCIIETRSLRFKKPDASPPKSRIFLPYAFTSISLITKELETIRQFIGGHIVDIEVKPHPVMTRNKKYMQLVESLTLWIESNQFRSNSIKICWPTITCGNSTSILETLETHRSAIHITTNPFFETYSEVLWPDISVVKISNHTYLYSLKKKGSFILFGEKQDCISKVVDQLNF